MRKLILSAICTLAGVSPAFASGLTASQTVQKEVFIQNEDGTTAIKYVPAGEIAPGEKVLYSLNINNSGTEPATDLVLVMPVPDEVKYIEGSADRTGAKVMYSADGGKSFSSREALKVQNTNGLSQIASAADITHVKWVVKGPIEAGSGDALSFRGVLK